MIHSFHHSFFPHGSKYNFHSCSSYFILLIYFLLKHYLSILYKITLFIFHNIHTAFLFFSPQVFV